MKRVGISIPVANEESTIDYFLDNLLAELNNIDHLFSIYIVMDNFSKDRTFDLVKAISEKDNRIKPVFYGNSTGVVSCYLKGFKCALEDECDFVIEMDSGGSHPPSKIKEILHALDKENYDVVFMSRFMRGGSVGNFPWHRMMASKGGTILAKFWLGLNLTDGTSGFQAFRAEVLKSFNLDAFISRGGIYQTEMKYYCGNYKIKEIPFTYVGSTSAFKFKWLLIALRTLLKIRSNKKNVIISKKGKLISLKNEPQYGLSPDEQIEVRSNKRHVNG
jgi:dolichol-phosphate mannosyltransferase